MHFKENRNIKKYEKCGHVAKLTLISKDLSQRFLFWSSSQIVLEDYYVNHKIFHAYILSGILQIRYEFRFKFNIEKQI